MLRVRRQEKTRHSGFNRALTRFLALVKFTPRNSPLIKGGNKNNVAPF